ncbi:Clavaminate synthase-like protein [Echria macrotheca]|uniref:Clavaminate synthase-like protein n=1 Tax=Echria macrotheca TaxID=438768 RepID=A0AAJ0BKI2_9PEZI|nr:Clavaminate synthase-like protein [Echria macrotheca]
MSSATTDNQRPAIATVDLSPFFASEESATNTAQERLAAGSALVQACHDLGFVIIKGHGLSKQEIDDAFSWTTKLFDLPFEEKMKAPHPPGNMPHRGYSGIGKEKVYSAADLGEQTEDADVAQQLRKISDFKESYEIGSEHDDQQQNIWLPDDVLPEFRRSMTALYERLADVAGTILVAFGAGLGCDEDAQVALMQLSSRRHSQLRLLHYPPITKHKLQTEMFARLPAHTDWGTFTILLQNNQGGLELRDPHSGEFLHAAPEEGTLVLNIGDMLQRFTNDYFISALHRVSVPDPEAVPDGGIAARYSIPFFLAPAPSHVISTLPQFVTAEAPAKYEPVRFDEYGAIVSKYQYQQNEGEE